MSANFYHCSLAFRISWETILRDSKTYVGGQFSFGFDKTILLYVFLLILGMKSREVKHYLTDACIQARN